MKLDEFDFDLPRSLIAERPVQPRDQARLLHVRPSELKDHIVRDLASLLDAGDLMVFNDTKVIPARLKGKRGAAGVEVTLHQQVCADGWKAFARPAKKLAQGDRIDFADGFWALVDEKGEDGEIRLSFNLGGDDLMQALSCHGSLPLPPYIKRDGGLADDRDRTDYQTIFAHHHGAVAAPTAGLHFTPDLLAALEKRGVQMTAVTLHVGAGTFLPVKVEDISHHRMHSERGEISPRSAALINETRRKGGKIVAIGTTSLRLLESAAAPDGTISAFTGSTDIFITPGYSFRIVDRLMTNFHLPKSTLFMLVSAFCGLERMKAAYEYAKESGYRFYSYGDASLLERNRDLSS